VPENGLDVICRGRVNLYEKRGEYQLILEAIEPKGIGALQLAFLQLKEKLEKEGLFDPLRKKPIPILPRKIGIVTSPTGAAIRDMLHIIYRRFDNAQILLYPSRVQGEGASLEIAEGIEYLSQQADVDVIIVGRGGGSLEDLWVFNEEVLARAIHDSRVPIISAVGHETDYTISDFVADLRAPTPSAAAELVVRDKREIQRNLSHLVTRLESRVLQILDETQTHLSHLRRMLGDPRKRLEDHLLRLDELDSRLQTLMSWLLHQKSETSHHLGRILSLHSPMERIEKLRWLTSQKRERLEQNLRHALEMQTEKIKGIFGKLGSLSPLAILQRGYSITRKLPSLLILRSATEIREGEKVEIRLHRGRLICDVAKTEVS
jgi:exodeoxyribonuclease VII large subunit